MMDQDLIDLLMAWRGGEIDPQRCDVLLARLRSDDEFLQSFVDEIRMLGMLKAVQSSEPRWLALQEELGWGTHRLPEILDDDMPSWLAGAEIEDHRRHRHVYRWVMAAAVFLAVSALLWSGASWSRWGSSSANETRTGLAIVVKLDRVEWGATNLEQHKEGALLGPGRFQFSSGQAMLFFLNGVTLTIEGPADVDLVSLERIFCRKGRLRARVPEGAEGFVVASANSAVVDMGTEFALNVEADGKSQVMVFEGAAEALLLDSKGSPHKTQIVEWNKQFDLEPDLGKIEAASPKPENFVAKSGLKTPRLTLDPTYADAILQAKPKGYWRFESENGPSISGESKNERTIPNELKGAPPLMINGPITIGGATDGNGFACFQPKAPQQFLTSENLWELPRVPGHAVEFWFMPEGISYAAIVGLFPMAETYSLAFSRPFVHALIVETTANETRAENQSASLRFLRRWPLQADLGTNLFSRNIYTPRRWQHVVAQQNGDRMEIFLDGVKNQIVISEPMHPNLFCRLVVGRRTTDVQDPKDCRPFVGRLDELAIYDHPLSENEIRRHHELGYSERDGQSPNPQVAPSLHQ